MTIGGAWHAAGCKATYTRPRHVERLCLLCHSLCPPSSLECNSMHLLCYAPAMLSAATLHMEPHTFYTLHPTACKPSGAFFSSCCARCPAGRMGQPTEVAGLVRFLALDPAALCEF